GAEVDGGGAGAGGGVGQADDAHEGGLRGRPLHIAVPRRDLLLGQGSRVVTPAAAARLLQRVPGRGRVHHVGPYHVLQATRRGAGRRGGRRGRDHGAGDGGAEVEEGGVGLERVGGSGRARVEDGAVLVVLDDASFDGHAEDVAGH